MRKRKIRLILIFLILLITGIFFPGEALSNGEIECIIIYPKKYQKAAENLQDFHQSYDSEIYTKLVKVEDIYAAYGPPPLEPAAVAPVSWPGIVPTGIKAYFPKEQPNSVLDILGYIQDTPIHGKWAYELKLQYVVILGNSLDVPPSYYVYSSPPASGYNAWIPTDFFYSVVNYDDLKPEYRVGRIPVKDQDPAIDSGTVSAITDSLLTDDTKTWTADKWIDYDLEMTSGSGGYYAIEANDSDTLLVSGGIEQSSATIDDITQTILTDESQSWTPQAYQGYALRIIDVSTADTGSVSGITETVLTDDDAAPPKNWTPGEWIDHTLYIVDGLAAGKSYAITGNTANTLTCSGATMVTDGVLVDDNYEILPVTLRLYTIIDNGKDTITVGTAPDPAQQGAASEPPGAEEFTDNTKTWTPDDWIGYALHITEAVNEEVLGKSYEITDNDGDTLTCAGATLYNDGVRKDDSYELLRGTFTTDGAVAGDKYEIYIPGPFLDEGVEVAVGHSYEIHDLRDDAIEMVNKISRWYTAAGSPPAGTGFNDWFKKVTLAAGQRYNTWAYWDEVATVDLINKVDAESDDGDGRTYLSGMTVNKAFHTDFDVDEGFYSVDIAPHLQNTDTGFLYLDGLGDGDGFHFDDGSEMTATDILDLGGGPPPIPYTSDNDRLPIVISCAHDNAAFDSEIYSNGYLDGISFGEAVVVCYDDQDTEETLADDKFGGGIAYIGASRTNYSTTWPYGTDDGRLTLDWPADTKTVYYIDELLQNVFKEYHGYPDVLGTMPYKAIREFVDDNIDGEGKLNSHEERALYGFTLLGDPALRIPKKPTPIPGPGTDYAIPILTALTPDRYNSMDMPVYEASADSTVTIQITTDASSVEYKLIDPENDEIHGAQSGTISAGLPGTVDKTFDITYDADNPTRIFFLKVSAGDENGREARLYFQVVQPFTSSTNILLVDDDQKDIYRFRPNPSDEKDYEEWYRGSGEDPEKQGALNASTGQGGLGYTENTDFEVWDVDKKYGEITPAALSHYIGTDKMVIWFTGDDKGTNTTTLVGDDDTADQYYLAEYLKGGGRLFLTGQDIGHDIHASTFFTDYLHAVWVDNPATGLYYIDGVVGDPVTHPITGRFENFNISGGNGAGNQNRPSEIDPDSTATTILIYCSPGGQGELPKSSGTAGLRVETAGYKVVYFSFGFEGIDAAEEAHTGRYPIMKAVVEWLDGTAASIPPTVTSVSPLDGATDIPIATNISATFSEEMDTTTVDSDTFYTGYTPGAFSWPAQGTVTGITDTVLTDDDAAPPKNWTPGEWIDHTLYIVDGLAAGRSYTITGNTADTLTCSGATMAADGVAPDNTYQIPVVIFNPESLKYSETYTVTITTDVTDSDGYGLDGDKDGATGPNYSWSFTTESGPDPDPPQVSSVIPTRGATGVAVNTDISTTFNEAMNKSVTQDASSISPSVGGSFSWSGNTMIFNPTNNLAYKTTYTMTITTAATDIAGWGLDGDGDGVTGPDYSGSFTTTSAPAVAGNGGGGGGGCFIATSAYSRCTDSHGLKSRISTDDPVAILQRFRDEYLLTTKAGRAFVATYYKVSPPVANFIRDKEPLKAMVRAGLRPLVWGVEKILK